jgi:hypothetical protein
VFTLHDLDGERFSTFEGAGTITPVIASVAGLQRYGGPDGTGSS